MERFDLFEEKMKKEAGELDREYDELKTRIKATEKEIKKKKRNYQTFLRIKENIERTKNMSEEELRIANRSNNLFSIWDALGIKIHESYDCTPCDVFLLRTNFTDVPALMNVYGRVSKYDEDVDSRGYSQNELIAYRMFRTFHDGKMTATEFCMIDVLLEDLRKKYSSPRAGIEKKLKRGI